ncbi:MAG: hypothetical protein ACRESJ_16825 [Pseudomonas sp.]|uniref:hypothetical protein n=1 Tax=Pseudomonas sp. TaxID=306 RepID=UPI003D6E8D9B
MDAPSLSLPGHSIKAMTTNYRSTIQRCIPITPSNQAHVEPVIEKKNNDSFTKIDEVRGQSLSSIEKMTQPSAQPDERDHLSPYMIDLLGRTETLSFAEKVLQASRKQLLDRLGIDDTQKQQRQTRLHADRDSISRFYNLPANAHAQSLTLNGAPFMEQDPTTPYFSDQKVITPDLRIYRNNENTHLLDLLRCKFRDDSKVAFDKAPIERLESYNHTVYVNESQRHENGESNKANYFIEMIEYLKLKAGPGDFIVQNSLESSSDKHIPHFQFIPHQVPLPIFSHAPLPEQDSGTPTIEWHLPSHYQRIDLESNWHETITTLQESCKKLLNTHHISTTPIFRMSEHDQIEAFLVFKKDGSSEWNMTSKEVEHTPGWLEACGIFIANTSKAEAFKFKGTEEYYAAYSVTAERIGELF